MFFREGGVVPDEGFRGSVVGIDGEDGGRDGVEEGAVMGDEEDGAGEALEVVLEPGDALEVEMVGGFVEEEGVGAQGARRAGGVASRCAENVAGRPG